MATLSGPEIAQQREYGHIKIEPWNPAQLNPNSYNLRLATKLACYRKPPALDPVLDNLGFAEPEPEPDIILDMAADNPVHELTIPPEGLVLLPGYLYLGSTIEYTETHRHVPVIEGRSSVGRLGICVHVTAGFGDIGFCGDWTLEIQVVHPVRVYAGVEICQIAYTDIQGVYYPYSGKYLGQRGPKPSSLFKDFLNGRVIYPDAIVEGATGETDQPPPSSS